MEILPKEVRLTVGNSKNEILLRNLLNKYRFDIVIHMAASVSLEESNKYPMDYYENNVIGSLRLLGTLVENKIEKIVFISSGAIYGDTGETPANEDSSKNPISCYGQTKLVIEEALKWFGVTYGLKHISLRYNCVAGAVGKIGSNKKIGNGLIPNILEVASGKKEKLFIYGSDYPTIDGTGVRSYVHLADVAKATVQALDKVEKLGGGIYNIGGTWAYSVLEVIEVAEEVTGRKINTEYTNRHSGDAGTVVLDISKAREELGWIPEDSNMENIIRTVWEWMKE